MRQYRGRAAACPELYHGGRAVNLLGAAVKGSRSKGTHMWPWAADRSLGGAWKPSVGGLGSPQSVALRRGLAQDAKANP